MKTLLKRLSLGMLAALLLGCTGQTVWVGPVTDTASVDRTRGRRIAARAQGFQLLLVLPIGIDDRHERAFRQLRDQAGEDVIADLTIRETWAYGVLGTGYTTTMEAMAYPRKRGQ